MAADLVTYLAEVELAFIASPIVTRYQVVGSWANTDDAYIRVRAALISGDFLETTEYVVLEQDNIELVDYRHQWMDSSRTLLRRRWDCTPHHPELDGFPHHVHVGTEEHVVVGSKLGVIDLLQLLEQEILH